ncbi:uncharacterized protein Z519_03975 [Cladophialophora bantiana CBS 173.52]|uniref:Zn(2)-C6 fungal-type domain-containing protein n=1 Tax=Cladophialophora bantiana (strain ATCC 10958 / CBS 173.52 / CDC B-1940 / NIH 8579) TaxID=1442370 RepID=A0A0D2EZN1_CLAB1|nr:uncharacterized protein Z519_03975 [Cladophialophora bantiana CBS 173.52]KIW95391.1 hypothetical protein Z519_03975 [Cladophialophora bantiana CBS 173.52]
MQALSPPTETDSGRIPKACVPCARAKVRCEIDAGYMSCKRCQRLKRNRSGQAPGAHRRKRANASVRPAENRDGVSAILAVSKQIPSRVITSWSLNSVDMAPAAYIDLSINNGREAEIVLQSFRSEMTTLFPFVVIPPSMTFVEMRQKKPFLVLAILMVCYRQDPARQTTIAHKLREMVSHSMLVQGKKSLDMLQALLVYLSWYHVPVHQSSQVGNIGHLIMALLSDLRLNNGAVVQTLKPSFGCLEPFDNDGSDVSAMRPTSRAAQSSSITRTLEERRTFLGCFFLISTVSMWTRELYPVQYSRYVDECCRAVSEAVEYPTDLSVVHLARLHGLADRISRFLTPENWHTIPACTSFPLGACVKLLESELLQLRASLSEGGQNGELNVHYHGSELTTVAVLLLHYHAIEILLYETALNDGIGPSRYGTYPVSRLSMLYACLKSTKLCFETAYTIPNFEWFDLPYAVWALLGHAIVVLSRLSLFKAAGWDQEYVRKTIDFSATMEKLMRHLDAAKELAETRSWYQLPRVVPQLYLTFMEKLRRIKAALEAKYKAQQASIPGVTAIPSPAQTIMMLTDDEIGMQRTPFFCDFLNDDFWEHFT